MPLVTPSRSSSAVARSAAYSLPKPPEIELHAGLGQREFTGRPLHALPADPRDLGCQRSGGRCSRRAKVPQAAQHTGRNVEQSAAQRMGCAAKSSSWAVSSSTATASPLPAAVLICDTTLSAR